MKNFVAPVDPVDRIPQLKINTEMLVQRAITKLDQFLNDRTLWIQRRAEFYLAWDDYLTPNHKGPWADSSNIHLPFTEVQINAMHARVMQGFFFMEPWFFVDPQEELDQDRIKQIELLMKYIVKRYANYGEGIYNAIHDWTWDTITGGVGILSRSWRIDQRRALIIKKNENSEQDARLFQELLDDKDIDMRDFIPRAKDLLRKPYKEEMVIKTVFNGPLIVAEDPEKILFAGDVVDSTDLNRHETVIKMCDFTRNQLIQFRDSGYMDADVVNTILDRPPDQKSGTNYGTRHSAVNHAKDQITGIRTMNPEAHEDTYEFACMFDRTPLEVDDKKRRSTLADELVYFVHPSSQQLARWTFLDRVHADGKRGLHMAHLYRRPRRSMGRGMVETQRPLNDGMDLLLNQQVDTGMLVNQPMFGYRRNATFEPEEMRVMPGMGIPCDDPNADIRFFNWNVNPNWSQNIIGVLQSAGQQLTSLGSLSSGQVGPNVGPLRSNAGAKTLLGETNINLDVILKQFALPYGAMLEGLFADCTERMPNSLQISVTGPDGDPLLNESGSPQQVTIAPRDLRSRIHFGLYANSQNLNRESQQDASMKLAQFLLQPIGLLKRRLRNQAARYIFQS